MCKQYPNTNKVKTPDNKNPKLNPKSRVKCNKPNTNKVTTPDNKIPKLNPKSRVKCNKPIKGTRYMKMH